MAMKGGAEAVERIWSVVAAIPSGQVASYGAVAQRAGLGRRARFVAHALKAAPDELKLPWHRVVNAAGRISFPPGSPMHALQRRLLEAEGVRFRGATIIGMPTAAEALDELLWAPAVRGSARRPVVPSGRRKTE
jgi:methylated-DNA-protein-cysteine methyltransferase-like protein